MSIYTTDKSDDSGVCTQAKMLKSNSESSKDEHDDYAQLVAQLAVDTISPVGGTAGKLMRR